MMTETTRALVTRLAELLSDERAAFADFIATLSDFDRQRRWAEAGYASLFDFLVRELGMSRGTAFYRKTTVELVRHYPEVLDALRDGRLCVTAIHALSKAITPENRAEVLPRFFHVSKQEAKAISAEIAPAVEVPRKTVVTAARAVPSTLLDLGHERQLVGAAADRETRLLAKDAKKKALVARPRPAKDPKLLRFEGRYIPAEIRREVWQRDQGRCQWPMEGGGVCGSTFQPELDHIDGFQPGKPITPKDLRVCCDPHNQEHARQVHGEAYMDRFRRRKRGRIQLEPMITPRDAIHPGVAGAAP